MTAEENEDVLLYNGELKTKAKVWLGEKISQRKHSFGKKWDPSPHYVKCFNHVCHLIFLNDTKRKTR